MVYSAKWNGNFTKREIAFLDDYYAHIEEGFALDNINLESYSQMVAKAKLHADNSYNKFRRGEISSKEYKEALDMFDTLSKSANFAACKRKPGDTPGLGSFGELVYKIEITGALQENYVEWPKDEVDRLIEEQRHIATALGIEGVV